MEENMSQELERMLVWNVLENAESRHERLLYEYTP